MTHINGIIRQSTERALRQDILLFIPATLGFLPNMPASIEITSHVLLVVLLVLLVVVLGTSVGLVERAIDGSRLGTWGALDKTYKSEHEKMKKTIQHELGTT